MREIKFRIWATGKGKMYTDSFHVNPDGTTSTFGIYAKTILMQYTGLKDKNGAEIYEGDIVRATGQNEFYLQVIEFHNTSESCGRGWIGRNLKQLANPVKKTPEKDISERFSYFCWPATWEVIGNIYENKELLNAK